MGLATLLAFIPIQAEAVESHSVVNTGALDPTPIIQDYYHIEDSSALGSLSSVVPTVAPLMKEEPKELKTIEEVKEYIIKMSEKYDVSAKLLLAIAKAESGFVINARNFSSTASGLYQYLDGTFLNYCIKIYGLTDTMKQKNNPKIQIECAVKMIRDGGKSHWSESMRSWSHALP